MTEARSGNKVAGSRLIGIFHDVCGCNRRSLIVVAQAIYDQLVPARSPLLTDHSSQLLLSSTKAALCGDLVCACYQCLGEGYASVVVL